jgi:PAS domain S-box-containing protein
VTLFGPPIVRVLCALCTGDLLVFFLASWIDGARAPVARAAYVTVYLSAAAVCLSAGRSVWSHSIRWSWLASAILSIPAAIFVAKWNRPASDLVALLFYPLAAVAAVPRARGVMESARVSRYVDLLLTCTAVITIGLYGAMLGVRAMAAEMPASFYVPLAPAFTALLAVPAFGRAFPHGGRGSSNGGYLLTLGLALSVFSDVTAIGIAASPFLWACAVWFMALGAAQASSRTGLVQPRWVEQLAVPAAWWPVAAVASVYALIVAKLQNVEPLEVRVLAIGGTVITTLVLIRQVTAVRENRALREARRVQEARFRRLTQHSSDVVVVLDTRGEILYHSAALAGLVALPAVEHIGARLAEVLGPEDPSALSVALNDVCDHPGRSRDITLSLRRHDEASRDIELTATNHCDDPAVGGIVVNIRDITERTQLERRLARQNKMEGVGLMAAGVAHEFNNLLTVIMGHTDLIAGEFKERHRDAEEFVHIRQAVGRAAELTKSLLGMARKGSTETSVIDPNAVIAHVAAMVRSGIGPEYEVVLNCGDGVWLARGNAQDLEHALLNLALNARDAMPGGGLLTVETRNVRASDLPDPTAIPARDYVRLSVADSGTGMSPEVLARAFQPFLPRSLRGKERVSG